MRLETVDYRIVNTYEWAKHTLLGVFFLSFRVFFLAFLAFLMLLISAFPSPIAAAPVGGRLYALMSNATYCEPICYSKLPSAIEIVDLATMTTIRTLYFRDYVSSLAVSPDGQRLYVTDRGNSTIDVFTSTGTLITAIHANDLDDEVISRDGTRLYVAGNNYIAAIDTISLKVVNNLTIGKDSPLGIALSADGSLLGAATTQFGQSPTFYLVNAGPLTNRSRIPITGGGSGCATFPVDVVFTNTGKALLYDPNCSKEYQVDVASATQEISKTISFVRGGGGEPNAGDGFTYSGLTARSYVTNNTNLLVGDPATATGVTYDGFTGSIVDIASLSSDGGTLLIAVQRSIGATLDRFDTLSSAFTRDVYTFSNSTMTVIDMTMLSPTSLLCGGSSTCSIQTNTDLSNLNFAGNTIHFTATGPPGTKGYANVTIPKSAIPNINQVKVFLNNTQLTSGVTITMNATDYFIYFTFTFHSIYDIAVRLGSATGIPAYAPPAAGLPIAILARRRRRPESHQS